MINKTLVLIVLLLSGLLHANEEELLIDMVEIPAGSFIMGSERGWHDERPARRVRISSFYIGRTEVTQGLWRKIMAYNPSINQLGDDYPVDSVSWEDIKEFMARLNSRTGRNYRLPTEAEWEYACRAGSTEDRYGNLDAVAWYGGNSGGSPHPVGRKAANAFGLHDMLGNVWEWCADWYEEDYYIRAPDKDPAGPKIGFRRVNRGGSWYFDSSDIRASLRRNDYPELRHPRLGFRLALDNK